MTSGRVVIIEALVALGNHVDRLIWVSAGGESNDIAVCIGPHRMAVEHVKLPDLFKGDR